jgi:hypothetical protein
VDLWRDLSIRKHGIRDPLAHRERQLPVTRWPFDENPVLLRQPMTGRVEGQAVLPRHDPASASCLAFVNFEPITPAAASAPEAVPGLDVGFQRAIHALSLALRLALV